MHKSPRKKNVGGYPATGVVFSITLALFVIGLFGLLITWSQELEKQIRQNIRVQVYLTSNVSETQRSEIRNKLLAMDYVDNDREDAVTFISRDEAAKKFIADTGEDFTQFLGENPLRDAFLVAISPDFHTREKMDQIQKEIREMRGVFQVFYVEGLVESVNENITRIALVLAGVIAILILTVVLLINNTLRIALFSQRFLIRSMQLVGARKWFIQRPFLMRSAGLGLLSGVLAGLLMWLVSDYAQKKIPDLAALHNPEQLLIIIGCLLAAGMLIAVVSTYFSIRKYLGMSLDELY
jgi:cell division transport system permease protein